jgi:hypothetical protein
LQCVRKPNFHINRNNKRLHSYIYTQAFPYFRIKAGDKTSLQLPGVLWTLEGKAQKMEIVPSPVVLINMRDYYIAIEQIDYMSLLDCMCTPFQVY